MKIVSVPSLIMSIRSIPSSVQKTQKSVGNPIWRKVCRAATAASTAATSEKGIGREMCTLPVIRESADFPTISNQLDIISLAISLAIYKSYSLNINLTADLKISKNCLSDEAVTTILTSA